MVKKSKGFSWGPAATGCSYWTGVRMSTLLRMARADGHEKVLSRWALIRIDPVSARLPAFIHSC